MNKLNGEMVVNGVKVKYSIEVEGTSTQILSAVKGVKDMVEVIKNIQGKEDLEKLDSIKLDIEHKGEMEVNYFGITSKSTFESKIPFTANKKFAEFLFKIVEIFVDLDEIEEAEYDSDLKVGEKLVLSDNVGKIECGSIVTITGITSKGYDIKDSFDVEEKGVGFKIGVKF